MGLLIWRPDVYRIVITKEEDVTTTEQVWQQIYADQDTAVANGAKHTHGYVDKKIERVKETQMLDQRLENLDLPKVVIAINNLDERGKTDDATNDPTEAGLPADQVAGN